MGKCLVQKLDFTIEDSNLKKLGTLYLKSGYKEGVTTANSYINIMPYSEVVVGDYGSIKTGATEAGKAFVFRNSNPPEMIEVSNKYALTYLALEGYVSFNLEDIAYCVNIKTYTNGNGSDTYGDIASLIRLTKLEKIAFAYNSKIYGKLESFFEGLFKNGKNNGTLIMDIPLTNVTINDSKVNGTITVEFSSTGIAVKKNSVIIASFNSSSWSYS